MGFLDRLLGRGKKATGDLMGDASMQREGAAQEREAAAKELDGIRATDPQKAEADRLRADLQRQLLGLATFPPTPSTYDDRTLRACLDAIAVDKVVETAFEALYASECNENRGPDRGTFYYGKPGSTVSETG